MAINRPGRNVANKLPLIIILSNRLSLFLIFVVATYWSSGSARPDFLSDLISLVSIVVNLIAPGTHSVDCLMFYILKYRPKIPVPAYQVTGGGLARFRALASL